MKRRVSAGNATNERRETTSQRRCAAAAPFVHDRILPHNSNVFRLCLQGRVNANIPFFSFFFLSSRANTSAQTGAIIAFTVYSKNFFSRRITWPSGAVLSEIWNKKETPRVCSEAKSAVVFFGVFFYSPHRSAPNVGTELARGAISRRRTESGETP